MPSIEGIVQDLREREQWRPGPKLPGEAKVVQSVLDAQTTGKPVELATINCIDFTFSPYFEESTAKYPSAKPLVGSGERSICTYYQDSLAQTFQSFQELAPTNLSIIVPDSELFDPRVFRYDTTDDERKIIGDKTKDAIKESLAPLLDMGADVMFWSEYCQRNNLPDPSDMTRLMFEEVKRQRDGKAAATNRKEKEQGYPLANAIDRQIKDSRKFLVDRGLSSEYVNQLEQSELEERTMWYCAMYMGEGAGIQILVNLEDGRVPAYYERGAQVSGREIGITTPVNPKEYTIYKRSLNTQ
jgi:hypothetical protein